MGAPFVIFFFWCTGFGLFIELGYDDVMNLIFSWEPPLSRLCFGLLVPFTPFYRPTGAALYRIMFEVFSLEALPFRILVYGLMLLNLFLVYKLAGTLSRSREIGAMSALLYTYHGRLSAIYLNNGTIYDVACATFTLLTIIYYVRVRGQRRTFTLFEWPVLVLLFVLALNAKEMGAMLPVLFFCYEIIYYPSSFRGIRPKPASSDQFNGI